MEVAILVMESEVGLDGGGEVDSDVIHQHFLYS